MTLVNNAIVHPSKPSFQWCIFHLPMSFSFWSVLHAPRGHLYFVSTTSTNPACTIRSFIVSIIWKVLPNRSPHSMASFPHSSHISPGWMEPSSDLGTGDSSSCSIYPPGARCLLKRRIQLQIVRKPWALKGLHLLVTLAVECRPVRNATVQEPNVYEVKVVLLVHPFAAAVVNLEAKIGRGVVGLNGWQISRWRLSTSCLFTWGIRGRVTYNLRFGKLVCKIPLRACCQDRTLLRDPAALHCPNTCSSANIQSPLGVLYWREKELIVEGEEKDMMALRQQQYQWNMWNRCNLSTHEMLSMQVACSSFGAQYWPSPADI